MKTREDILAIVKDGRQSDCLDGRDYSRLVCFFPLEDWSVFGCSMDEAIAIMPLTEENVLNQLKGDLDFAFYKALGRRGISASLMFAVIKMWLWVLDDNELCEFAETREAYPMYGLPLLKKVAVKYGFPNEIGDDEGNESKYSDCEIE